MQRQWTRRDFMTTTALGAVAATANWNGFSTAFAAEEYKTKLRSAFILPKVDRKRFEQLAAVGIEGVEISGWDVDVAAAREGRKIAEETGINIHSVMRGWTNFNNPNSAKADVESVKKALAAAAAFGATAILLVPCRVGNPGPKPWDFKIDFDPKTLMVKSVCEGDNAPFAEYIKLQNEATDATYRCMEELIPVAEAEGVTIGIENVWNNLWCMPNFYAAFVRSFGHERVKAYFDLGNHVKYAKTEDWLRACGKDLLVKLHIKDFKVDKSKGAGGDFVPIGKGSVDWKSVRDCIEEIGYNGWVTQEAGGYTDKSYAQIFADFFAGKPFSVQPDA